METAKYKVGDKVTIRKHLRSKRYYGTNNCVSYMLSLRGKEATIEGVFHLGNKNNKPRIEYKIDIDGGRWYWTEQMFEKGE